MDKHTVSAGRRGKRGFNGSLGNAWGFRMKRRDFLKAALAVPVVAAVPALATERPLDQLPYGGSYEMSPTSGLVSSAELNAEFTRLIENRIFFLNSAGDVLEIGPEPTVVRNCRFVSQGGYDGPQINASGEGHVVIGCWFQRDEWLF